MIEQVIDPMQPVFFLFVTFLSFSFCLRAPKKKNQQKEDVGKKSREIRYLRNRLQTDVDVYVVCPPVMKHELYIFLFII